MRTDRTALSTLVGSEAATLTSDGTTQVPIQMEPSLLIPVGQCIIAWTDSRYELIAAWVKEIQ